MPGTFGTLPAVFIAYFLISFDYKLQLVVYLLLLLTSYIAADTAGKKLGNSDHKQIVCDEIIGVLPLLLYFPTIQWFYVFVLFRLFDIVKPWPISLIDQKIKGAGGCLLDDIMAGACVFPCLYWF
jgi:phosphatidylglycerophosphatase A